VTDPGSKLFTRAEVLGGLPVRRASTILFGIEGTAARLAAASRINRATYVGERTAAEREVQFLRALSSGGELASRVRIADLERFAPDWSSLVPSDPDVRAAIARLLGAKHRFRERDVPRIRAALGLEDAAVAAVAARFDRMPPFWIAYFIALGETLGEGIMSVPLALAGLGPLPGVILLLVLGTLNLLTVAALTESITRSGSMRFGTAYFGRFVRELLGRMPSRAMNVTLALLNVLTLFIYLLGFASVLTGATGIAMGLWIAVLFGLTVVALRNETLDDTVASATIIGTVNLVLVVAITVIALGHVDQEKLAYVNVPLLNGQPLDPTIVGLAFGVILVALFGHTAAANASKMVLTLEPSGRALLWGNVASMATIIGLYCVASIAFLGVLGPDALVGNRGTAITPLGDEVGPIIHVLGSIYVVLAIGIGSVYVALGLYNQVIELLPRPEAGRTAKGIIARLSSTRAGRLAIGFAPAAAVAVALELIVLAGEESFAGTIAVGGVLGVPLVTGVFPLLLVVAARRKGEYVPGSILRIVGHPIVVIGGLAVFLLAVALHGLVIWEGPFERAAALATTVATAALIAWIWRSGVLRPRAVVEIRRDQRRERTSVWVTAAGRAVVEDAPLDGASLAATPGDAVAISIPAGPWRELRLWPHEVTTDGWSLPLAAELDVTTESGVERHTLAPSSEPQVVAVDGAAAEVRIRLGELGRP